MSLPIIGTIAGVFNNLTGVVSELVEDKDKRNEILARIRESENKLAVTIVSTTTTPKADAFVKISYAFIPFFRPIGSAAMTVFAAYAYLSGIVLPTELQVIFGSAFPGWMYSRHVDKKNGK